MELCKDFTCSDWRALRKRIDADREEAWSQAIGVFKRRMNERFFRCIETLLQSDKEPTENQPIVPGFAIMALCCLLVETLQSFYEGGRAEGPTLPDGACPYPNGCAKEPSTARAFKQFLKRSPHFNSDFHNSEIRGDFSQHVRNALLHEAETRKGWLIRKTVPRGRIVQGKRGKYVLNRTEFYNALRAEFGDYIALLGDPSKQAERRRFLSKMDGLCLAEPRS
jgi:hypothetical protein